MEEGLDIEAYKDIFYSVSMLPKGEIKKKFGDVLFEAVTSAGMREGYPYMEPSELEQIQALRRGPAKMLPYDREALRDKIYGAWLGRICDCMLGKSLECVHTEELISVLKASGNYPMHRYVYRSDLEKNDVSQYKYNFAGQPYADEIDGMPGMTIRMIWCLRKRSLKYTAGNFRPMMFPGHGSIIRSRKLIALRSGWPSVISSRASGRRNLPCSRILTANGSARRSGEIISAISIRAIRKRRPKWPGGTLPFPM